MSFMHVRESRTIIMSSLYRCPDFQVSFIASFIVFRPPLQRSHLESPTSESNSPTSELNSPTSESNSPTSESNSPTSESNSPTSESNSLTCGSNSSSYYHMASNLCRRYVLRSKNLIKTSLIRHSMWLKKCQIRRLLDHRVTFNILKCEDCIS